MNNKPGAPMQLYSPVQQFARCINDANKPADYVGDWPVAGNVYEVKIRVNPRTHQPQLFIVGFRVEKPWGAFTIDRFVSIAFITLN